MAQDHPDNDKTQAHVVLIKDAWVGYYQIIEKIGERRLFDE